MISPAIYPSITPQVWQHLVASRLTPEFQELWKLQQARRAANDNQHHLGRKGYANLEVEIVNNLTQQQQLDTEDEIDRSFLWPEAHKNKDGE